MYSKEHIEYIKNIKKRKFKIIITQLTIITLFLIIWQILASTKIVNTFITSSPANVLKTVIDLIKANNLWPHISITLFETLISFIIGTIAGIIIASILWWNDFLAKVFDPYLTVLNSLPKVALGPILIIIAGANIKSIILMALLISIFITIINVYEGFQTTDINKIKLLKSLNATKQQIYFKLILPANKNAIISTLKISVSMSLVGVIMGELLVSKRGLGYLIMYGSQVFNLNLVITSIIILAILSTLMYYLVLYIEKKITKN